MFEFRYPGQRIDAEYLDLRLERRRVPAIQQRLRGVHDEA